MHVCNTIKTCELRAPKPLFIILHSSKSQQSALLYSSSALSYSLHLRSSAPPPSLKTFKFGLLSFDNSSSNFENLMAAALTRKEATRRSKTEDSVDHKTRI
ncbi:hypothetical protein Nepgr_009690 [Nepenthes gracilis]|uniref:Uncharacterized protein n=1 Tax=Nepenthes gracilis TaxID=150966 RepID=A0AAD3SB02_NEPGR|nr:hypothetical protein Nepgr_009690 [Nepenthes gracilis]